MSSSEHQFETHLEIPVFMMNRDGTPTEAPNDQVLTAAVENDSEKKTDSNSTEKREAQSVSYRRSRDVGLMKLALLRPENDDAT